MDKNLPTITLEYRKTAPNSYDFVNPDTGKRIKGTSLFHIFESESTVFMLKEKGVEDVASFKNPFVKGKVYVVAISSLSKDGATYQGSYAGFEEVKK